MPRKISRRVSRIWERLGQWYGSRLADNYGPTPPDDWADLIDRTDDERIEDALLKVRRDSPIHPPTLGQMEAAIPRRQEAGKPTKPQMIAELMLTKHGGAMCKHQRARPWSYFGPQQEFRAVTHADPRGAVAAACDECGTPAFRVLLEQSLTTGAAA